MMVWDSMPVPPSKVKHVCCDYVLHSVDKT